MQRDLSAVMETLKLVFIFVLLLSNVCCQEMDADIWRQGVEEGKWPNSKDIQDALARVTRKLGSRQHPGLLGRKDSGKTQTARKRHKFQTFVGLMGKRSSWD